MKATKLGPVIFIAKGSAYKIEQNVLGRYIRQRNKGAIQAEKNLLIQKELKIINESSNQEKP